MRGALRDVDIRRGAHAELLACAHADPNTLVVDELGLNHGGCRVDVAVVNGHIQGIEIKSDVDNLARLSSQIAHYGSIVDCATLVATGGHVGKAGAELPDWWGLVLVTPADGGVAFEQVRPEGVNPGVDAASLVRLLWRAEAVAVLASLGVGGPLLRKPRAFLYEALVERVELDDLRARVRSALKTRSAWRGRARPA